MATAEQTFDDKTRETDIEQLLVSLADHTPRMVQPFAPSDLDDVKSSFLSGEIAHPIHSYPKLEELNYAEEKAALEELRSAIEHPGMLPEKYLGAYEASINESLGKIRLLEIASLLKTVDDTEERQRLSEEFMRINIEIYGEPEREVYDSILTDLRGLLENDTYSGEVAVVRDELAALLPHGEGKAEKFIPSAETEQWMRKVADSLYAPMYAAIDTDVEKYDAQGVREIFEQILRDVFGEVAEGWTVEIAKVGSVEVQRLDKRIVIPQNKIATPEELKGLVVHELGVHFLKVMMGESTDMTLMATGFAGYYDAEEAIAMAMQQAATTGYKEAGVGLYLTASLAYFGQMPSEDVYEILWRKSVLEKAQKGVEITDQEINDSRDTSYKMAHRIFRGTDELPWFKDLSYHKTTDVWKHLESICGDDFQLMLLLMGKNNPLMPEHVRVALETKSI